MGRKNRKGRTRNMGRGKQIRTTLANDILLQQNAVDDQRRAVVAAHAAELRRIAQQRMNPVREGTEGTAAAAEAVAAVQKGMAKGHFVAPP